MRALLIAVLLAAPAAATDGPVFKGFGTHTPVEHNVAIPKGMALRHVYDVTKAASGKLNPGFETAARFINSHVANGVSERDVAVAVVVATIVVLHRKKMMARSKSSFTSTAFLKQLRAVSALVLLHW